MEWGAEIRALPLIQANGRGRVIGRLKHVMQIDRVRRNHALEHAAITIITERHPHVFLRGRSNSKGFFIFGEVGTDDLSSAVQEALQRMRSGEEELAIHPRCGTNLAVASIMSGLSAAAASQLRPRQNRWSYAVLAAMAALVVAPRVGLETQRHLTTLADLGDLHVTAVERRRWPFFREPIHFVSTES
jgi:hypothetical protein